MRDFNKVLGCIVGGAAGDALGYAVEFWQEKDILDRYGKDGIKEYKLYDGKAIVSDDTQMTLFTAAGILMAEDPKEYTSFILSVYQAYQEWLTTQGIRGAKKFKSWLGGVEELFVRRAPGNTCLSSLMKKKICGVYEPINQSKGCGGVMRVAPIGLFYSTKEDHLSIEDIDKMGAGAAALTHGHPLGYLPAAGLVHIIERVTYEPAMSLFEVVEDMIKVVADLYPEYTVDNNIFADLMKKAVFLAQSDVDDLHAIHELGEGWVGEEALAIAIYCALKYQDDFDLAIRTAVNHKGDSDSTGAIAGNILGAYLGYEKIPNHFTEKLEMMDVMVRISKELCEKGFII